MNSDIMYKEFQTCTSVSRERVKSCTGHAFRCFLRLFLEFFIKNKHLVGYGTPLALTIGVLNNRF